MIDKDELHRELVAVEKRYGSVMKAPNSAMAPIWKLTNRTGKPVHVSQRAYDMIEEYVSSLATAHPQRAYTVARVLRHDPTWLRYRVQAYQEERLVPVARQYKKIEGEQK
ncbi:hypothetical protein EFP14_09855 [Lactiplantibacillus pentosus]|jgi:hypothetical protein|nr:hypothetical protein [Lactiplantibacillus pentosus]